MAKRFFLRQGLALERMLFESQSRNTAENARRSFALVKPAPGESWVLVTSAFHMPRALRSFERAGWTGLVPWPVDYRTAQFGDDVGWNLMRNLEVLGIAVNEYAGQLAYRLAGR
ncbi:YdcF family protein [Ferrimonas balearica]|nr:YdcF family protein [Ferrimonas balearica]